MSKKQNMIPLKDLAKRSRYYQALIDTSLLEPGVLNYNLLNQTYIIMITPFDLFGYGKYKYTFEAKCREIPELDLNDGAARIFLNTRGTNEEEISRELIDFLHYAENSTSEVAKGMESERIKRIHDRVCKVRLSEEIGVKYMQAWEEKYYEREEGRREGQKDIIRKKLEKGKRPEEIADALEESVEVVLELIEEIKKEELETE